MPCSSHCAGCKSVGLLLRHARRHNVCSLALCLVASSSREIQIPEQQQALTQHWKLAEGWGPWRSALQISCQLAGRNQLTQRRQLQRQREEQPALVLGPQELGPGAAENQTLGQLHPSAGLHEAQQLLLQQTAAGLPQAAVSCAWQQQVWVKHLAVYGWIWGDLPSPYQQQQGKDSYTAAEGLWAGLPLAQLPPAAVAVRHAERPASAPDANLDSLPGLQ